MKAIIASYNVDLKAKPRWDALKDKIRQSGSTPDIVVLGLQEFDRTLPAFLKAPECFSDALADLISFAGVESSNAIIKGLQASLNLYSLICTSLLDFIPGWMEYLMQPWIASRNYIDALLHSSVMTELTDELNTRDKYELHYASYGPTAIVLWRRVDAKVTFSAYGCGRLNLFHNKGGVCATVDFGNKNVVSFVANHLAAHEGQEERRTKDLTNILQGLRIYDGQKTMNLLARDISSMFVFGDLNYRLRMRRDELTKNMSAEELLKRDELGFHLHRFPVKLQEASIAFLPTYKKSIGKADAPKKHFLENYDYQKRLPAWCDRILYGYTGESRVNCVEYTSLPLNNVSDHDLVFGVFEVNLSIAEKIQSDMKSSASSSARIVLLQLAIWALFMGSYVIPLVLIVSKILL